MSSTEVGTWAAGWYEDSGAPGRGRRFWDGSAWTDQFELADSGAASVALTPSVAEAVVPEGRGATTPMGPVVMQQTVINTGSRKSVGAAVLLAFFFGPLGMLYATVLGAIVMALVNIVVGVATFGVGLAITWPIGVLWAAFAASSKNNRQTGAITQVVNQ